LMMRGKGWNGCVIGQSLSGKIIRML